MFEPRSYLLLFVILWWTLLMCQCSEPFKNTFPREFDFRYTSYEDILNQVSIFNHESITVYTRVTVDEYHGQLLVGARDGLFRLSLDNLNELEYVAVNASDQQKCFHKGHNESLCHNFVRVLLLHNYTKSHPNSEVEHAVLACGTDAFVPICSWRSAGNLSQVLDKWPGTGKCPYDPTHNTTAIITSDGSFYGGTTMGPDDRDPAIYRSNGKNTKVLRTELNSKWLNEPDFISSYEIGEVVYFFFREIAVEFASCGKRIYSRVARVCKSDQGGVYDNFWTTFFKARLNCSLPGNIPFYFDEIQNTFLLDDGADKYIYAVFNTPENSIAGSAVCIFNVTSLSNSFSGPFKFQENANSLWERHEQQKGKTPVTACPEKRDQSKRSNDKEPIMENKYQLMDNAVQPSNPVPFVYAENERWSHIVVDNVRGKQGKQYNVVFIVTASGKIRKLTNIPGVKEPCLVEEISIVPNGELNTVTAMNLSKAKMMLYLTTTESILAIPVHRCSRFTTRDLCINASDPYCGWSDDTAACTPAPLGQPEVHYWSQSISSCPFVSHAVNGNWSAWTEWNPCSQLGGDLSMGDCKCRSRLCDNPRPYYGGQTCVGASVQVTNCTAHGQWTEWTSWSSCTQTCGPDATKRKNRYCSNPPPRFGGRNCVGVDFEEEYCQAHPPCPLPQIKSSWLEWSEWSECSAKCNGGIQTRRRTCNDTMTSMKYVPIPCVGNTQDWRLCNSQICEQLHQLTPWTRWVATNHTKGGHFQERFRFECKASVPSQNLINAEHMKSQSQFCVENGQCQNSDVALINDTDGGWSEWTVWSGCSRDCGGGLKLRRRECNNQVPLGKGNDCYGHAMEGRDCNAHMCQGVWSCWSSMSACSVSCGSGTMSRLRECESLPPGNKYTVPCDGDNKELVQCDLGPCINIVISMSVGILEKQRFNLAQMFLMGGLCFILGGSASLALYAYIKSFWRAMKNAKHQESFEKLKQKQCQQALLEKRQSLASIKIASFASQASLDRLFNSRNKVYDVETVMRDFDKGEPSCTLDRKCALKMYTMKDM